MAKTIYALANKFAFVIFVLLTLFSCWRIYLLLDLKYGGEVTTGVIIGYQTKKSNSYLNKDRKLIHAPIFQYSNLNDSIKISTTVYNEIKEYEIGDTVQVCYKKDNLTKAQIKGLFPWRNNIYMLIVGIVGIFVTTLPFFKKIIYS